MKITGAGRIDSSGLRLPAPTRAAGEVFTAPPALPAQANGLTGSAPITAVGTLLALQDIEDAMSGKGQGAEQGEQLLNILDELRDGLLMGGIPRQTLTRLAGTIARRRAGFSEPKLEAVLDEIELRARVELAKLEWADEHAT